LKLDAEAQQYVVRLHLGPELNQAKTVLCTTAVLGKARVPGLPYESRDGSPLEVRRDFFGKKRVAGHPCAGPFANPGAGEICFRFGKLDNAQ
jgi:alpha-N-arabinofuranosidase